MIREKPAYLNQTESIGRVELSLDQNFNESLVRTDSPPSKHVALKAGFIPNTVSMFPHIKCISQEGYFGTHTNASAKQGDVILNLAAYRLIEVIQKIP